MGFFSTRYGALGFYMLGMAVIPLNDALMKQLSDQLQVFEYLAGRGTFMLIGVLLFPATFAALRLAGWKGLLQAYLRGSLLVLTLTLLFLSISMIPLASAYALFFTAPMIISLLAIPLLGERPTFIRLAAMGLGMLGVLLVTQPWGATFTPWYGVAMAAACVYASYQLVTRMLPQNVKLGAAMVGVQLAYISLGCLVALVIWSLGLQNTSSDGFAFLTRDWVAPNTSQWLLLLFCAAITLIWTYSATHAYMVAEASFVAPFEYIALPLSAIWGYVLLSEVPSPLALGGMAVIVFAGILMAFDRPQAAEHSEQGV